jgi:hypothetical protein
MKKYFTFLFPLLITAFMQCRKPVDVDPQSSTGSSTTTPINPSTGTGALTGTIYVATTGNDDNDGSQNKPFRTLAKAVAMAAAGATIELRAGTYESREIPIEVSNLTIRSFPGERATIKAVNNVEEVSMALWFHDPTIKGGLLENLDIEGGYYYTVKFESNWDWDESIPFEKRFGVSNVTIRNCRIHDSGRDCVKITPGCNNIQILNCEIYRSGVRDPSNAEGIDNVNANNMVVRNCYLHDIATNGLYAKGGARNCIIENNLIMNVGEMGITAGFLDTDAEWFDLSTNPNYQESFDIIIRNNIIANAKWGGVGLFAAVRSQVVNNTFVNVASNTLGALHISRGETYTGPNGTILKTPPCRDLKILNNIFVQPQVTDRPMIRIRYYEDDMAESLAGTNQINYNRYFHPGTAPFYENRQQRNITFAQWRSQTGFDANSSEGDPGLNAQFHLVTGSPCTKVGIQQDIVTADFDGNTRTGKPDLGADETGGAALTVPPPAGVMGTGRN